MPCFRCHGEGAIHTTDSVPYGDTWVAMPVSEECPACVERGVCPQCGAELVTEERRGLGRFIVDARWCNACGWQQG